MNQPLNTILYGPPGTGKTYATTRRCVEICAQPGERPEQVRSRYKTLVSEGRVEFVTFHQSYGYEEFVEGLRPETEGDGGGLRLAVRDGVLKRISERARAARAVRADPVGMRRFYKVELGPVNAQVFRECMEDGCVRFGYKENWCDEDWSDSAYDAYEVLMNRFKERWGPRAASWWNSTSAATFRSKVNHGDIIVVPDGKSKSKYLAMGTIAGDYAYTQRSSSTLWPHRRAVHWHWKAAGDPESVGNFGTPTFSSSTRSIAPTSPRCWAS